MPTTKTSKTEKRKNAIVNSMRKAIADADAQIASTQNTNTTKLRTILSKLEKYYQEFSEYSADTLDEIDNETLFDAALEADTEIQDEVLEGIGRIKTFLENPPVQGTGGYAIGTTSTPGSNNSVHDKFTVKLPKLQISYYDGDPLKWLEFWDTFCSTIHERKDLPGVEKFKYLQSYLKGDAKRFLAGYPLSNDSYDTAVEALTKRFGDTEVIIQAHLSQFLALPVAGKEVHELRKTYDECERHIRSLVALDLKEDQFGRIFAPIMQSKFPYFLQVDLNRSKGEGAWTLEKFRALLSTEIAAREGGLRGFGQAINTAVKQNQGSQSFHQRSGLGANHGTTFKPQPKTASAFQINTNKERKCVYCSGKHFHDECSVVPDVASRRSLLVDRCYKCLSPQHRIKQCTQNRMCQHCKGFGHHRSLCLKKFPAEQAKSSPSRPQMNANAAIFEPKDTNTGGASSVALFSHGSSGKVGYLHTALAQLSGTKAETVVRLLLDNGSTVTFITNRLAKKIGAKLVGTESMSIAGFQTASPNMKEYRVYSFALKLLDGSQIEIQAHATDSISCPILRYAHDLVANPVLQQVKLADTLCSEDESVELELLIGGDYYYDIVGDDQIRCSNGIVLLNSKLGYIVAGKTPEGQSPRSAGCMFMQGNPEKASNDLQRLWRLEDIGIKETLVSEDNENAIQQFEKSVQFDETEQRYMVGWPWNSNKNELSDNFGKAYGRLTTLVKRLKKQPEVLEKYTETLNSQLSKGIIEKAPEMPEGKVHYLPHHEVITPDKETTKLRVVYDGSCKPSKNELSLNDCLLPGPVLLEDMAGLLMRFRLHKVGLVADIEKAFLQIGLHKNERDVTRFLWLKNPYQPPTLQNVVHYRFSRVCFGTNSSPFLLAATINHHCKLANTELAKQIATNIYVDNLVLGAHTRSEAKQLYAEAKQLLASASMNLREWYSNSSHFTESLPNFDKGKSSKPKVLGLNWDVALDALSCPKIQFTKKHTQTKRGVLQTLAQAYDPCGFFTPVTVRGKIFLQKLWKEKLSWDDSFEQGFCNEAQEVVTDIQSISQIEVPRCIAINTSESASATIQLHCFSDASELAYSVAIYLRQQMEDNVKVDLVFGKSRVAPVKKQTIPRLELIAATLASRLAVYVREQLRLPIEKTVLWSDSQCVLHWILGKTATNVFVRNRVEEIRNKSELVWRYVPTETNPADIPSRGMCCNELTKAKIWWHGPQWLDKSETEWPDNISVSQDAEAEKDPQADTNITTTLAVASAETTVPFFDISRFSTLRKAIGVMSKVLQAVHKMRKKETLLDHQAREVALQHLTAHAQSRHIEQASYANTVRHLKVYQGADRLSRCRTRIDSGVGVKHPILLPKSDPFTKLLIWQIHCKLQHAGVAHILAEVRYEYWIPKARQAIKAVLHNCPICRRHRGPAYRIPEAPPLPDFRTQPDKPFACTGIDYLGPLYIKCESETKKVWVCLMTCSVTRAIHLEVVENMNTEQFLLAMRRFMSLYGTPTMIVSDHAQQFHLADKVYTKLVLESNEVQEFVRQNSIQWKFVVEMAPWMGGFYERMVGLVKKSLRTAIHTSKLTLTELQTVVYETSAVLNTRPLVYSEDETGFHPITPAHLLLRHKSTFWSVPASKRDEYFSNPQSTETLTLTWKRIQNILEKFWRCWRKQYLTTLHDSAWSQRQRNVSDITPSAGDVVLIHDDKLPRGQWHIARIQQLVNSTDGVCRAAILVRSDRKTLRRPLKLLHPLEMSANCASRGTIQTGNASAPQTTPLPREGRPRRAAALDARWKAALNTRDQAHECQD